MCRCGQGIISFPTNWVGSSPMCSKYMWERYALPSSCFALSSVQCRAAILLASCQLLGQRDLVYGFGHWWNANWTVQSELFLSLLRKIINFQRLHSTFLCKPYPQRSGEEKLQNAEVPWWQLLSNQRFVFVCSDCLGGKGPLVLCHLCCSKSCFHLSSCKWQCLVFF